ncbi:MAG: STAS domain-containing protein [Bacteroidia bacterium]|nr:STAS domain-containing protein [Bacteroidia bacterium]
MSEFSVGIRQREQVAVFDLKGYLDAHTAPELERAFQKQLEDRCYSIVVNFRDLAYISSAGLGVLMQFIEDVRKNEGDIKLSNMSPRVFNVFDLLGFPMLYEIFPEEDDAVGKFLNKSANLS